MFNKTVIVSLLLTIAIISFNTNNQSIAHHLPAGLDSDTSKVVNVYSAKKMSEREIRKELKKLDKLYKEGAMDKASYEGAKEQLNLQLQAQEEVDLNQDKQLVEDENFERVDDQAAQDEPETPEEINEFIEETGGY